MTYSKDIYESAREKMQRRQSNSLYAQERRKNEVYQKDPRFQQIDDELSQIGINTAKAILQKNDEAKSLLNSLKEKSLSLQEEYADLLKKYGYSDDYLEVKYNCEKCKDTGFFEKNGNTVMCDCMKKLLQDIMCEKINKLSPLELSTFDTFNLSYYKDELDKNGKNPYETMVKIFNFCEKYANEFTDNSKGILMRGGTGLGKTHLSLAIANKVIKKGYSVVYVSAIELFSQLEFDHFHNKNSSEQDTIKSLVACDLLIIDDLGTEYPSQYTKSVVYNIFNSRVLRRKPVIINTNLTVNELVETYSSRFFSRVIETCTRLDFIGTDNRTKL